MEFLPRYPDTFCIAAVHDVDDGLRVGIVTPPVGPDGGLAPQVPHLELDVLVRHRLHIEPNGYRERAKGVSGADMIERLTRTANGGESGAGSGYAASQRPNILVDKQDKLISVY